MPHIDTARIRTYYERAGDGPRLLYISGTGSDLRAKPGIFDSLMVQDRSAYGRMMEFLAADQVRTGSSVTERS